MVNGASEIGNFWFKASLIPSLSDDDRAMIYDRPFKWYSLCVYGDTNDVGRIASRDNAKVLNSGI